MQEQTKNYKQYISNFFVPNYFAQAASRGSEEIGGTFVSLELRYFNYYHQQSKKTQYNKKNNTSVTFSYLIILPKRLREEVKKSVELLFH